MQNQLECLPHFFPLMLRRHLTKLIGHICHTLVLFGFSRFMYDTIIALYSCPSAQVYTSKMLSKTFLISNGTQQGCPLSLMNFNLPFEPLAEIIRSHRKITSIQRKHTIQLFTYYISLLFTDPISCMQMKPYRPLAPYHITSTMANRLTLTQVSSPL